MRNSSGKIMTNRWFNTKLFYVNGERMKFYLEGFSRVEFSNATRIIEAYGGELARPDDNPVFFSEPGRSIGNRVCYNLKYFRDSIVANGLLKLEEYKLASGVSHRYDMNHNRETNTKSSRENFDANGLVGKIKEERTDEDDSDTRDEDSATSARTRPLGCKRKRQFLEQMKKEGKKFRQSIPNKKPKISDSDSSSSEDDEEDSTFSSTQHSRKNTKMPFSDEENRQIMQYLIDNNAINRTRGRKIWEMMIRDERMTHRTPDILALHFKDRLRHEYKKYTDNEDVHVAFEQLLSDRIREKYFSKNEERQMIEYLIHKKAILRAGTLEIWRNMVLDYGLSKTAYSLMKHFDDSLKLRYQEYTRDDKACSEFEKLLKKRNSPKRIRRTRWSSAENQLMIDYLIDKNIIHEAKRFNTWEQMWREVKFENVRTVKALYAHYWLYLRFQYGRYTNDPKALKKFAALNRI